jgi:hypothetical protein
VKKLGGPIHVASVDLEKRTITIGGTPPTVPHHVPVGPVREGAAMWRTCPQFSWSSCDECPLPIACLSIAQCALAPLEEETP